MKFSELGDLELGALLVMIFQLLPESDRMGLGRCFLDAAGYAAEEIRMRGAGRNGAGVLFDGEYALSGALAGRLAQLAARGAAALEAERFHNAARSLLYHARYDVTVVPEDARVIAAAELRTKH